jgi:tRNA-specific 2-thiouridylase
VIAGFMKNYADESNPHCHTREDRDMALKVSQYLGIKTFVIFDFRKEYDEQIIQYIYDSYEAGLTPNPDVFCNSEVKFKLFLEEALKMGCDGIAMGHYARIEKQEISTKQQEYRLLKGIDTNKDQSYFLSRLNQFQLSKAYFPIGHLTKLEVRKLALDLGLPNAERKDSQGLCFIGKVSIKDFVSKELPKIPGPIYDLHGNYL